VKSLLLRWYRHRARRLFRDRLTACLKHTAAWSIASPKLQIRKMAKRWGSCSAAGTLTLNPDLVRASRACIDYVITHELCHLKYLHHSREFYTLLTAVMPDWQDRKQLLERMLS
jgi:predicted metal-dependent hydrolase